MAQFGLPPCSSAPALLDYWWEENPSVADDLRDTFERAESMPLGMLAWGMVP